MTADAPIFNVVIDDKDVVIKRIRPGRPDYDEARKNLIVRERDAIELFQNHMTAGNDFQGTYSFQFIETAKTFAMLHLKMREEEVENNLDSVQAYEGATSSSAGRS